jgi:hypothetical protein
MDYTIKTYQSLLNSLLWQGFSFQRFDHYLTHPEPKAIILRHDVDLLPENSWKTAQLENSLGISGTYYFRAVAESWDERIMKEIASMGHEVGYHYECLTKYKGNYELAIEDFKTNLSRMRNIVPITTVCMHGSPLSKYDNRFLWEKYDFVDYGIIGEPYFDIDFSEVLYLTDTGRRWDGEKFSIRDKTRLRDEGENKGEREKGRRGEKKREGEKGKGRIKERGRKGEGEKGREGEGVNRNKTGGLKFHSTFDIIKAANESKLPDKIMITVHPQRWTNKPLPWAKELVFQNIKNVVKRVFYVK